MTLRIGGSTPLSAEAIGPFRIYLLTHGLLLNFAGEGALITDGDGSSLSFPESSEPNEFGRYSNEAYKQLLETVEREVNARLICIKGESSYDAAFRTREGLTTAPWLAEALLDRLLTLEGLVKQRVVQATGTGETELMVASHTVANIEDEISYGRIGPIDLQQLIDSFESAGIPMREAFFMENATSIAEDMRHAMLSACHHYENLAGGILAMNHTGQFGRRSGIPNNEPWEQRLSSDEVDALSFDFASSVIACYTALDLIYLLFVYLTREPFLNPEFPRNLHFPDAHGRQIFRYGGAPMSGDAGTGDLPYAVANIVPGQFGSLRYSRNALVHSMMPDSMRAKVYQGWQMPPINNQPLLYVQYLSRDVDIDGEPIAHPWVRRFYEKQTDAQENLFEWLQLTWQCAFDTIEWLIQRWSNHVDQA